MSGDISQRYEHQTTYDWGNQGIEEIEVKETTNAIF
jgi:hypothetical protein